MMTRLRGRGARGQRVIASIPHGHCGTNQLVCPVKTSTFIAGLRNDRITAPMVIDKAMNGVTFLA